MRVVAEHGVPMCPIVGYEPDPDVLGQPFFVMGFVEGRVPSDVPRYTLEGFLVDEATPEERHRLVSSGLEAMARVHAIDWRDADLGWLDASGGGDPTLAVQLDLYRRFATDQLAGRPHPRAVPRARLVGRARSARRASRVGLGRLPARQHHLPTTTGPPSCATGRPPR